MERHNFVCHVYEWWQLGPEGSLCCQWRNDWIYIYRNVRVYTRLTYHCPTPYTKAGTWPFHSTYTRSCSNSFYFILLLFFFVTPVPDWICFLTVLCPMTSAVVFIPRHTLLYLQVHSYCKYLMRVICTLCVFWPSFLCIATRFTKIWVL